MDSTTACQQSEQILITINNEAARNYSLSHTYIHTHIQIHIQLHSTINGERKQRKKRKASTKRYAERGFCV